MKNFLFLNMMNYYNMKKLLEISEDDQRRILDFEQDLLDIKRDLIGAEKEDAQQLKDRMEDIKQQITDIKDRASQQQESFIGNYQLIESILNELGRTDDLGEWNKLQFELWLELNRMGVVERNDAEKFAKFGAFFYSYWMAKKKLPKIKDILAIF